MTTLASLVGTSDLVVVATFETAHAGQSLYDVDGKPYATDRLQDLRIQRVLRGDAKVGQSIELLSDGWDGAGKGIQTEYARWLKSGDRAIYFLDKMDGAPVNVQGPLFRMTSGAGRIELTPGTAVVELSNPDSDVTKAFVGVTGEGAIRLVEDAISNNTSDINTAADARTAKDATRPVPSTLPPIAGDVWTLDTVKVPGHGLLLQFARRGALLCYGYSIDGSPSTPSNCFDESTLLAAQPATQFLVIPVADQRVLVGFSHEAGRKVAVKQASGPAISLDLKDVPGVTGLRFFDAALDAGAVPTKVKVTA